MNKDRLYDWDERTLLIHDLWVTKDLLADARYRCETIAAKTDDRSYDRIAEELAKIWKEIEPLYVEVRYEQ